MKRFFNYESGFWSVMSRVFDLVALNFIWLLTSLPVITIGASTTALYSVTLSMARDEDSKNISNYFRAFVGNFKQATIIWLIYLFCCTWLIIGVYACSHIQFLPLRALAIAEASVLLIIVLGLLYVFAVQAQFSNTVRGTIASAQTLALRHLPWSLAMLVIIIVPVLITVLIGQVFNYMMFLWIFLGASGLTYLESLIICHVFAKAVEKERAVF